MLECPKIEPSMEIRAAGDNLLHSTVQGILLVVGRGTDDVSRKVNLPTVLVPGWKRNISSSLAEAQKCVKTIIENNESSLDRVLLIIQLTRLDNMDHLNITIAKESGRAEFSLRAISGKTFGKESVRTVLVPEKPVALSVGSIDIDQRVVENALLVEDKNNSSTYKIHHITNKSEQVESNDVLSTNVDTNKKGGKSSKVNSCERTK